VNDLLDACSSRCGASLSRPAVTLAATARRGRWVKTCPCDGIDPLDLLVGHVEDGAIALAEQLYTSIDASHLINMGEIPGFGCTIVVTAFFEDDGDVACPQQAGAPMYGYWSRRVGCGGDA